MLEFDFIKSLISLYLPQIINLQQYLKIVPLIQ